MGEQTVYPKKSHERVSGLAQTNPEPEEARSQPPSVESTDFSVCCCKRGPEKLAGFVHTNSEDQGVTSATNATLVYHGGPKRTIGFQLFANQRWPRPPGFGKLALAQHGSMMFARSLGALAPLLDLLPGGRVCTLDT